MTHFNDVSGPRIHLLSADADTICNRVHRLAIAEPEAAVRLLRGLKMTSEDSLFDEISAACQFPYYFGYNWDALRDCMSDLAWMPAQRYVILIGDADAMAAAAPQLLSQLLGTLNLVALEWALPAVRALGSEGRPFHILLQCQRDPAGVEKLMGDEQIEFDRRLWREWP